MMFKRKIQEINAGSMADIAFLLLIFFLVSTTINTDQGIHRKLPPVEDKGLEKPAHKNNLLSIVLNGEDELMANNEAIALEDLKAYAIEFISNPERLPSKPASPEKALLNFQNTRNASYNLYIQVQNELTAAYHELRNEEAISLYSKTYRHLSREEKEVVKKKYPMRMTEATIASNE